MILYIILPVFNEADNLQTLFEGLKIFSQRGQDKFQTKIILVDDGSTDDSLSTIRANEVGLDIAILSNQRNQGPGVCFSRAFAFLQDRLGDNDWVVTMEADNTSRLKTLEQMLVRRMEGYEVILASPYAYGGGFVEISLIRVFISHAADALVKIIFKIRGLTVFSSFFRLYSSKVLRRLYSCFGSRIIECNGFECMVELLFKLILVKATISEVEMKVDWSKRSGKSKMKVFRTTMGYFRVFCQKRKWVKKSPFLKDL